MWNIQSTTRLPKQMSQSTDPGELIRLFLEQLEIACRTLDSELKAAADVQHWLLRSLPAIDDIGIAASYRTARYSGGDYYDVGLVPDGRLGFLIADVSGKGAPAAVLMAVRHSAISSAWNASTNCYAICQRSRPAQPSFGGKLSS